MASNRMTNSQGLRPLPVAYHVGSILVLVWVIMLVPLVTIEAVSHVLSWKNVLFSPIDSIGEFIREQFHGVAWITNLPAQSIGLAYVGVLLLGIIWYYWSTISFFTKRELETARRASRAASSTVGSQTAKGAGAGAAVAGAGAATAAGILAGAPLLGIAAAAGPPGWLLAAVVLGVAAVIGSATRGGGGTPNQTASNAPVTVVVESPPSDALQRIMQYRQQEIRKVIIATGIVFALVIYSFIAPSIFAR